MLFQKQLPGPDGAQVDDRTDEMHALFSKGLKASNIWYGHAHTFVLLQTLMPDGFEGRCRREGRPFVPYEVSCAVAVTQPRPRSRRSTRARGVLMAVQDSGWCFVESTLSSLIKGKSRRIDLGMFTKKDKPLCLAEQRSATLASDVPPTYSHASAVVGFEQHIHECTSTTRPPPMLPSRVAAELEHKAFFQRADVPRVVQLYEAFFDAVVPSQKELTTPGHWGRSEVDLLVEALPRFERLKTLDFSTELGPWGAIRLAEALRVHTSLTKLCLICNRPPIGDEGAIAIAHALVENEESKLATLCLYDNGIGDPGSKALASLCSNGLLSFLSLGGGDDRREGFPTIAYEGLNAFQEAVVARVARRLAEGAEITYREEDGGCATRHKWFDESASEPVFELEIDVGNPGSKERLEPPVPHLVPEGSTPFWNESWGRFTGIDIRQLSQRNTGGAHGRHAVLQNSRLGASEESDAQEMGEALW